MRESKARQARAFGSHARTFLALGLTVATALLTAAALLLTSCLPLSIDTYRGIQFAYSLNDMSIAVLIITTVAVYLAQEADNR